MASGPDGLQWGHGDEAVEESTGPPGGAAAVRLQWGHGDEAVEEVPLLQIRATEADLLQWGHGDEAVEEQDVSSSW